MEEKKIITLKYERDGKEYTHELPPCSKYEFISSDVDKEGSGRNEQDGSMYRERIGKYCKVTVSWDLIPNTIAYRNLVMILEHLPKQFTFIGLDLAGNQFTMECYRSDDLQASLYYFEDADNQIWRGLQTSFTQWNVEPYDDSKEPILLEE